MGASLLVAHAHGGTGFTTTGGPTTVLIPYGQIIATTANYDWRLRGTSGGTVSELRAYASANTTTTATCTLTARLNGSDQSLSLSWSAGQTGEKQDTTNSFSASAGDDIDYAFVRGSESSKAITLQSISVRFDADTSGDTIALVGSVVATGTPFSTASTTRYITPSHTDPGTSERAVRYLGDCTLGNLYVYVASNARTTTTTFRSRVNGANGAQSVSYTSGQTGVKEDTTNTDSITSGDDFCWSISTGSGSGIISLRAIFSTAVSADGEFDLFVGANVGAGYTSSTTRYLSLGGIISVAASTEANAQSRGFAADYYNLRGSVRSNASNGTTTVTFRVEGADAGPTISWTSGQTGHKEDTSNTASCADDDLLGFKVVNAGTGTCTVTYLGVTGAAPADSIALSPVGIASTTDVGTPALTITIAPDSLASTAALGAPALALVLGPDAIASTAALGTPSLDLIPDGGSDIDLSPVGIASTAALGTPTLSLTAAPSALASTVALGVAALALSMSPAAVTAAAALGAPGLTVTLTPDALDSTAELGAPTLSFSVAPVALTSAAAFGTPTLALRIAPAALASAAALGTPTLEISVTVVALASTDAIGTPALAPRLTTTAIPSSADLGSVTIALDLSPVALASAAGFGSPALEISISVVALGSTAALGTPSIATRLTVTGISATGDLGAPTLTISLNPPGFTGTSFGLPTLVITIEPTGLVNTILLGTPHIELVPAPTQSSLSCVINNLYTMICRDEETASEGLDPRDTVLHAPGFYRHTRSKLEHLSGSAIDRKIQIILNTITSTFKSQIATTGVQRRIPLTIRVGYFVGDHLTETMSVLAVDDYDIQRLISRSENWTCGSNMNIKPISSSPLRLDSTRYVNEIQVEVQV